MVGIRDAVIGDVEAIADLHVRSWQAAYRGLVPDEHLDALDPADRAASWRSAFARPPSPGVHRLVSTRPDGAVVAVANFGPAGEPYDDVTGELYVIYAAPEVWGEGHGSALLREVRARLAADGHDRAMLWMMAGNDRTLAIYEHHGWVADGATREDEIDGIPVRMARLVLDLR